MITENRNHGLCIGLIGGTGFDGIETYEAHLKSLGVTEIIIL